MRPNFLSNREPPSCLHDLTVFFYSGHCDKPRMTCCVQGDVLVVSCNVKTKFCTCVYDKCGKDM